MQKLITYAGSLVDLGSVRPWKGLPRRRCASLLLCDPTDPVDLRTSTSLKATRWSEQETSMLQTMFAQNGTAMLLSGSKCRRDAVRDNLVGQDLVHISAPGCFDSQVPLKSSICVANGEHVNISDEEIA